MSHSSATQLYIKSPWSWYFPDDYTVLTYYIDMHVRMWCNNCYNDTQYMRILRFSIRAKFVSMWSVIFKTKTAWQQCMFHPHG